MVGEDANRDEVEPGDGEKPNDATEALADLVDAMGEQLDAANVEAGAEPDAYKFAVGLLGRPARRAAAMPAYVRPDRSYVLVVVYERDLGEDEPALRAQKRTPAEQLSAELQDVVAGRFRVAEPSRFAAQGFAAVTDPVALQSDAEACAIGPVAVPVIRSLVRALGSRDAGKIQAARAQATALLSKVNG